jgi:hypothetical protein
MDHINSIKIILDKSSDKLSTQDITKVLKIVVKYNKIEVLSTIFDRVNDRLSSHDILEIFNSATSKNEKDILPITPEKAGDKLSTQGLTNTVINAAANNNIEILEFFDENINIDFCGKSLPFISETFGSLQSTNWALSKLFEFKCKIFDNYNIENIIKDNYNIENIIIGSSVGALIGVGATIATTSILLGPTLAYKFLPTIAIIGGISALIGAEISGIVDYLDIEPNVIIGALSGVTICGGSIIASTLIMGYGDTIAGAGYIIGALSITEVADSLKVGIEMIGNAIIACAMTGAIVGGTLDY